jgi:hypothetical protein
MEANTEKLDGGHNEHVNDINRVYTQDMEQEGVAVLLGEACPGSMEVDEHPVPLQIGNMMERSGGGGHWQRCRSCSILPGSIERINIDHAGCCEESRNLPIHKHTRVQDKKAWLRLWALRSDKLQAEAQMSSEVTSNELEVSRQGLQPEILTVVHRREMYTVS